MIANRVRNRLSLIVLALLALCPAARAQLSLTTVVDLAQRNSGAVRMAEADVQKAQAQLAESRDVVIPSVQFATGLPTFPVVGFTGTPPSIWSASVQSLIYGIPQKHYNTAASFGVKAAGAALKSARDQVALDAATAYIELDTVERNQIAARQQLDLAERLVQIELQRAEAGVDPLSDLLQARLTQAQLKLYYEQLDARARALEQQLSLLTALPAGSIVPDHASIPELPKLRGDVLPRILPGIESANLLARSRQEKARGDNQLNYLPQLSFNAQYNRSTTLLNDVNKYFAQPLPANNFSAGIAIQFPLFDMSSRAKARESAADALRAKVEAEQAQRQNDSRISALSASLRQLDALAEIAELKRMIAAEQVKSVLTQLELGNGSSSAPQLSPRAEQQARIDERQRVQEAENAAFELSKARLNLIFALGHMQEWLHELHSK